MKTNALDQELEIPSYPERRRHWKDLDTQMKHNVAVCQGGNLGAMK